MVVFKTPPVLHRDIRAVMCVGFDPWQPVTARILQQRLRRCTDDSLRFGLDQSTSGEDGRKSGRINNRKGAFGAAVYGFGKLGAHSSTRKDLVDHDRSAGKSRKRKGSCDSRMVTRLLEEADEVATSRSCIPASAYGQL
jgi:hypothetical protein